MYVFFPRKYFTSADEDLHVRTSEGLKRKASLIFRCPSVAWFGLAVNNLGSYSSSENDRVLIYCSDAHLTLIDANKGSFRDKDTMSTVMLGPLKPGHPSSACSDTYEAFGYPMGVEWGCMYTLSLIALFLFPILSVRTDVKKYLGNADLDDS